MTIGEVIFGIFAMFFFTVLVVVVMLLMVYKSRPVDEKKSDDTRPDSTVKYFD